ncbi:MAG: hypothetical protein KDE09_07880 [Anaerolineales bacterium]|nr:hypothetical protein [Anaerolineales bacterium]MCB0017694.1 hypothetical protein [Anaerolineales bacterium]
MKAKKRSGRLYVTWQDDGPRTAGQSRVQIRQWDGSAWSNLGNQETVPLATR